MKKVVFTAALLMIICVSFAQRFTYGLKAGVNITGAISYNKAANATLAAMGYPVKDMIFSSRLCAAFHGGAFVNLALGKKWYLQPEVLYSSQQYKLRSHYSYYDLSGVASLDFDLTCINVPIMMQYRIKPRLYLEAGPQIGFLTKINVKGTSTHFGGQTRDMLSQSNTVECSLALGLGYQLQKIPLGFYTRATLGLTNVLTTKEASYRNYIGQAGIFYQFGK
ncbi:Outer membrane protein beta-barrel domain-containing protein [Filimonas lacunae]|uniref:Outer membrane protein beta-barrel domain-containing protein n=1 Tax=Filimonas lacunae TaxID=477680 RepID=A0A173MRL3_9BACT|nr:porin family protein [Filimonas lacunae]BAV10293.1 hypothetical protein FLA_6354 [Filimonas lacunae]SIT17406.1 Outer membrane protein beta-barrel domain-containing protein [Filimonas lacunae]